MSITSWSAFCTFVVKVLYDPGVKRNIHVNPIAVGSGSSPTNSIVGSRVRKQLTPLWKANIELTRSSGRNTMIRETQFDAWVIW